MNISYRWLRSLCPGLALSPQEVAEALALRGAPVEELLALAPGLEGLLVARVEAVAPHPRGEHLKVCQVNAGGDPLQVVCGAPNVRAGGWYAFAPAGAHLPGGTEIGRAAIGGVESDGMLCSEAELLLGPDADGLLELEAGPIPGEGLARALGLDDWRLDVEVTANRGDLLSHAGLARELAPVSSAEVVLPAIPGAPLTALALEKGESRAAGRGVTVSIEDHDLCSRYLGAVVRGVRVGPSPAWLAARLRAAGSRPINNVVDATNYVLLELGQPLHAFELARLKESTVVVRRAREGELIRTLDGQDRRLAAGMLAICDAADPVAVAGVMGGLDSQVTERTTDILLECALFEPASIRSTRRALGLSTDASYRFERGVDPDGMERAVGRALEIILAVAGGTPDPAALDVCPRPWRGLSVALRPSRVRVLLGIALSPAEITGLLTPLGFRVAEAGDDLLQVEVPGYRSYDVLREVDLLEEVARAYGYDRFPQELGSFRPGNAPDHPLFRLEDELRDLLVGEGILEAQTMAFAPAGEGEVEVSNPVSAQEGFLRGSLLPGLLRRVEHNFARGARDVRLFELGTAFALGEEGGAPREEARLAVVLSGGRAPLHWEAPTADLDLWDLKGLLARLVPAARLEGARVAEGAPTGRRLAPGEGYSVMGEGDRLLGWGGRVEAGGVDAPAWAAPVWGLELALPPEPAPRPTPLHAPPPAFPGVDRDLAHLLPKSLPVRQVETGLRGAAGPLLARVTVFDLYQGKGIPEGYRSVAFRLRFQSGERTLTDRDVEHAVEAVVERLREDYGVNPRS